MRKRFAGKALLAGAALSLVGVCWGAQPGHTLLVGDDLVSSGVQIWKGRAYVPVHDVAQFLRCRIDVQGNTLRLVARNSGATPSAAAGKWQLTVYPHREVASYTPQFGDPAEVIRPKAAGDVLLLVRCQLKNGTGAMQDISFNRDSAGETALRDSTGHGYVPLAFDSRNSEYTSNKIPAGTLHEFVIVFGVPRGTLPRVLDYTVSEMGMEATTQFRVRL